MKLFSFFDRKPDVVFVSPLPLEECQARLFSIIDRQHRLPLLSERPITRRVNDSDFYLARGMVVLMQGVRPPDLAESAARPVLFCCLLVQSGKGSQVLGSFGFHSLKNGLVLSVVALWLAQSLCLALGLILGRVSGAVNIAWALMFLPLLGPLVLALIYLHERTYLPYLTVYLRRVLLDPSLDSDISQFSRAPYSRFARGLQIVLFLMTGSVIGTFIFLIFQHWQA